MKTKNKEMREYYRARRYFTGGVGSTAKWNPIPNIEIAARLEAMNPGSRQPDETGKAGIRKFIFRMYRAAMGLRPHDDAVRRQLPPKTVSAPTPAKIAWQVEGVDVASKEFLQTRAWRALRYQAIRRYGARCMCCGASRETGAVMNVDHIKPRRHHPELALDIGNLQILCGDCNAGKGNSDETDWRIPVDPERTLDAQMLASFRERGTFH